MRSLDAYLRQGSDPDIGPSEISRPNSLCRQHRPCTEHRELHEAISAGDTELAASLAFVHVERGRRPSLESLKGLLPPGTDPVSGAG
ncbi:MAG TPA: hypothetical protein VIU15_07605 [Streptomyces sp.]